MLLQRAQAVKVIRSGHVAIVPSRFGRMGKAIRGHQKRRLGRGRAEIRRALACKFEERGSVAGNHSDSIIKRHRGLGGHGAHAALLPGAAAVAIM